MDSVLVDDRSFVILRQTHQLRFNSLSMLQPSILSYSQLIEVSTSLGRAQPLSTEATAMNWPLLFKMRAKSPAHALRIRLPCATRDSSLSDTSIEGHEESRRFIEISFASVIRSKPMASSIRNSPDRVRRNAVRCAPHPAFRPRSCTRLRT